MNELEGGVVSETQHSGYVHSHNTGTMSSAICKTPRQTDQQKNTIQYLIHSKCRHFLKNVPQVVE